MCVCVCIENFNKSHAKVCGFPQLATAKEELGKVVKDKEEALTQAAKGVWDKEALEEKLKDMQSRFDCMYVCAYVCVYVCVG